MERRERNSTVSSVEVGQAAETSMIDITFRMKENDMFGKKLSVK